MAEEVTLETIARQLDRVLEGLAAIRGDIAEIRDRIQSIEAKLSHLLKQLENVR